MANGKVPMYQYGGLRNKEASMYGINGRPAAWRVPFLHDPNYDNNDYTVSHLCHDESCYNWHHHVLELLAVNKGRNGCPGGPHCHHKITCIIPGPFYNY